MGHEVWGWTSVEPIGAQSGLQLVSVRVGNNSTSPTEAERLAAYALFKTTYLCSVATCIQEWTGFVDDKGSCFAPPDVWFPDSPNRIRGWQAFLLGTECCLSTVCGSTDDFGTIRYMPHGHARPDFCYEAKGKVLFRRPKLDDDGVNKIDDYRFASSALLGEILFDPKGLLRIVGDNPQVGGKFFQPFSDPNAVRQEEYIRARGCDVGLCKIAKWCGRTIDPRCPARLSLHYWIYDPETPSYCAPGILDHKTTFCFGGDLNNEEPCCEYDVHEECGASGFVDMFGLECAQRSSGCGDSSGDVGFYSRCRYSLFGYGNRIAKHGENSDIEFVSEKTQDIRFDAEIDLEGHDLSFQNRCAQSYGAWQVDENTGDFRPEITDGIFGTCSKYYGFLASHPTNGDFAFYTQHRGYDLTGEI